MWCVEDCSLVTISELRLTILQIPNPNDQQQWLESSAFVQVIISHPVSTIFFIWVHSVFDWIVNLNYQLPSSKQICNLFQNAYPLIFFQGTDLVRSYVTGITLLTLKASARTVSSGWQLAVMCSPFVNPENYQEGC